MTMETDLNYLFPRYIYLMVLIYSWSHGRKLIHISITNKLKLVILKLLPVHMVHQDNLDKY